MNGCISPKVPITLSTGVFLRPCGWAAAVLFVVAANLPRANAAQADGAPPEIRPKRIATLGVVSPSEENDNAGSDPAFTMPIIGFKPRVARPTGTGTAPRRFVLSPDAGERAEELAQKFRDRLLSPQLLGGHKYMADECHGLKVSTGMLQARIGQCRASIEGDALLFAADLADITCANLRVRFRPNVANEAKPCLFSNAREVTVVIESVHFEIRLDPVLDVSGRAIIDPGMPRVSVRIGRVEATDTPGEFATFAPDMVGDAVTCFLKGLFVPQLAQTLDSLLAAGDIPASPPAPSASSATGDDSGKGTLVPCLANTGDWQPIGANLAVPTTGNEMLAVFQLGPDAKIRELVSTWTVEDVGDIAPRGYELGTATFRVQAGDGGVFRYTQSGPLPAGKYRLAVAADGTPWKEVLITAQEPETPPAIASADLFPLRAGTTWTYDFVQEAGRDAKLAASGMQADADGKLRATVIMTVEQRAERGSHVLLKRNGTVVAEEWWIVDARGLVANQRITNGELLVLDPPQVLLASPTAGFMTWTHTAADGAFTQRYRQWWVAPGRGTETGIILVVTEQDLEENFKIVVERQFAPGQGMTREVITVANAGHLLSRQTMTRR